MTNRNIQRRLHTAWKFGAPKPGASIPGKLNRLGEVFVEIVQETFLFVSFCHILYIVLHSGTVWTIFKVLSPSRN